MVLGVPQFHKECQETDAVEKERRLCFMNKLNETKFEDDPMTVREHVFAEHCNPNKII